MWIAKNTKKAPDMTWWKMIQRFWKLPFANTISKTTLQEHATKNRTDHTLLVFKTYQPTRNPMPRRFGTMLASDKCLSQMPPSNSERWMHVSNHSTIVRNDKKYYCTMRKKNIAECIMRKKNACAVRESNSDHPLGRRES